MEKSKKLICYTIVFTIILYCVCSYNIVSAYAIKYNNTNVGYVPIATVAENEITAVENKVNSKIADGVIDVKKDLEIEPAVYPVKKTENTGKVAQKVLNSTAKQLYCLEINNIRFYTADTEKKVNDYLSHLINYACIKYDTPEAAITVDYSITHEYLIGDVKDQTDEYMISLLGIKASKTIVAPQYEEIAFSTIKQYGNKSGKVIQKGVPGTLEKQVATTYVNDIAIKSEVISTSVVVEPISKIITTNVYDELPENTLEADASILELDSDKTAFLNTILPVAIQGYHDTGILPSLTMAQAILESGFGTSPIGNNIFGMKVKSDWTGKSHYVWTKEQLEDGTYIDVKDYFKDYDSLEDSVKDYLTLLSNDRYQKVRESHNYFDAACAVRSAGYATSLAYAKNLVNVIEKYKLYLWDKVNAEINHPEIIVPIQVEEKPADQQSQETSSVESTDNVIS